MKNRTVSKAEEYNMIATEVFAPIYPVIAGQIAERTGFRKGLCIDLGSAAGHLGMAFARITGMDVILLDNSPDALKLAEERITEEKMNERISVLQSDVHSIPLSDGSVDLAISRGSIWFWEDKKKALLEIYRILKKGRCSYIGGGFGTRELKEKISAVMAERTNNEWNEKAAKRFSEFPPEYFINIFSETGMDFEIVNDDSGFWIILKKQGGHK